jgi:BolA protein
MSERIARMRALLEPELAPLEQSIDDDSHKHVGHAGARDGRGHFSVRVVSTAFDGLPLLARHRRIYAALGDMMQTDIHALAIQARTPQETTQDKE